MKLSKREKNMLLIAVVFLLSFGSYLYIITPIHEENTKAVDDLRMVDVQYNSANSQMKSQEDMDALVTKYRDQITLLENELPSTLHLDKMIDVMYGHFESYEIVIDMITFADSNNEVQVDNEIDSEMGFEKLQQPMSVDEILNSYEKDGDIKAEFDVANTLDGDISYDNISYMSVTLSFTSNYDVLKKALIGLEELDNTTVITNMTLAKNIYSSEDAVDENGDPIAVEDLDFNEVAVSLSLSIPYYYDYEENEEYIYEYPYKDDGNHNPFNYEVISEPKKEAIDKGEGSTGDVTSPAEVFSHFNVYLNPSSSDQPAQNLAYYDMSNSKLVLDSNINEKYELKLIEENDVIYFMSSNDNEDFPGGAARMIVSDVKDDINIKVISSRRISSDDLSGMTLWINNETSRKVNVHVFYDDEKNPRFNIIRVKGLFEVIKH